MSNGSRDGDQVRFEPGRVRIILNASVYSTIAIQKAGYNLAKRCSLLIEASEGGALPVSLLTTENTSETDARELARDFLRELGDQQLRLEIADQTKAVRELVLAHAFSNTDLVKRE